MFARIYRVSTNVVEKKRHFGAVLHRRNEQVGQLKSVTSLILVAPLNIDRLTSLSSVKRQRLVRVQFAAAVYNAWRYSFYSDGVFRRAELGNAFPLLEPQKILPRFNTHTVCFSLEMSLKYNRRIIPSRAPKILENVGRPRAEGAYSAPPDYLGD